MTEQNKELAELTGPFKQGSPPITEDLDLENKVLFYKVALREHEEVFEIIPKHLAKILTPVSGAIALLIIAVIILFVLLFTAALTTTTILIVFGFFGLITFVTIVYTFSNWFSYISSALIITNQRLIDVHQQHFLYRHVQETELSMIRNITCDYDQPFGHLLHYGYIRVERMSTDPMIIYHVPIPKVISLQIMHYHNVVIHGGIATAHNYAAQKPAEDATPELAKKTQETKDAAVRQGIPVKS